MGFSFQFSRTNIEENIIFQKFTHQHQPQLFRLHEKFMFSLLLKTVNESSLIFNSFPLKIYNQKVQASLHETGEFKKYVYKLVILYRYYVTLVSLIQGLVQLLVFLHLPPPLFYPRLVPLPSKLLSHFCVPSKKFPKSALLFCERHTMKYFVYVCETRM